jgi:hypothetical protein
MKTPWLAAAVVLALSPAVWSAEKQEEHLTMTQVPAPVKATIDKESAGGKVDEIEKETEHGRTFYEAEIVKNGKTSYIHVSDDGKVLKRETVAAERKAEGAEKEEHERAR